MLERITVAAPQFEPWLRPPIRARVIRSSERPQSSTAVVALEGKGSAHRVFVKAPFRAEPSLAARPRLGLDRDFDRKHEFEWQALKAMWDVRTSDDTFAAVRPLLHEPSEQTLVLDMLEGASLRVLLDGGHYEGAMLAAGAAGRWLARFQQLEGLRGVVEKRAEPDALVDSLDSFERFLRDRLVTRVAAMARPVLAATPVVVGLGHADFAPRNVLITASGVCAIDPLGLWRVPVLEDVAYFVLELQVGGRPRLRAAEVTRLRAAFLEAHGTADDVALAATEALVLFDKLAALRTSQPSSPTALARHALRRRRVLRALEDLETRLRQLITT